jgi:hypothetical protein
MHRKLGVRYQNLATVQHVPRIKRIRLSKIAELLHMSLGCLRHRSIVERPLIPLSSMSVIETRGWALCCVFFSCFQEARNGVW